MLNAHFKFCSVRDASQLWRHDGYNHFKLTALFVVIKSLIIKLLHRNGSVLLAKLFVYPDHCRQFYLNTPGLLNVHPSTNTVQLINTHI